VLRTVAFLLVVLALLLIVLGVFKARTPTTIDPQIVESTQPEPRVQSGYEGLKAAAEQLAFAEGMSVPRAMQSLRMQGASGGIIADLREEFSDRLAGIYVEHSPEYRIFVRLKGWEKPDDRIINLPVGSLQIVFIEGAKSSVEEALSTLKKNRDAIINLYPTLQGYGVDEKTGEAILTVFAIEPSLNDKVSHESELENLLGHPAKVKIVSGRLQDISIRGGEEINIWRTAPITGTPFSGITTSFCTAGFVTSRVGIGAIGRGLLTAEHCFGDTKMFIRENGVGQEKKFISSELSRDVQNDVMILTSQNNMIMLPEIYTRQIPGNPQRVRDKRPRADTTIGFQVCHSGRSTGYSCGFVADVNYTPIKNHTVNNKIVTNPIQCGGISCPNTYVYVDGPDLRCAPGDSGGPVFNDETAFGIVSSGLFTVLTDSVGNQSPGDCLGLIYSSIDFLPYGWDLLYAPCDTCQ